MPNRERGAVMVFRKSASFVYTMLKILFISLAIILLAIWIINSLDDGKTTFDNADQFCIDEGYEEAPGPINNKYCQKVVGNSIIQKPIKEIDGKYYWVEER